MEGLGEIGRVPEDCVSHVLSLTTPRDSCRSAAVSSAFRRAADSDDVWSQFLPSDYQQIMSRAVDPPLFSSLKELYFLLCDSFSSTVAERFLVWRRGAVQSATRCAHLIWGSHGVMTSGIGDGIITRTPGLLKWQSSRWFGGWTFVARLIAESSPLIQPTVHISYSNHALNHMAYSSLLSKRQ